MENNTRRRGTLLYLFIVGLLIALLVYAYISDIGASSYTMAQFRTDAEAGNITDAILEQTEASEGGKLIVYFANGGQQELNVTSVREVERIAREDYGIDVLVKEVPKDNWFINYMLPLLVVVVIVFSLYLTLVNLRGDGSGGHMMDFGKSRMRDGIHSKVKLKDVAGLKEEKEELDEIIQFLKDPTKFTKVGARIPKGVLLEGPPGTGKTLLAKAIAGEADVPFYTISGSDFVEMFVGVGASRVRDMFEVAKKTLPCIVFIDEIDAVARRRGTGMGGGHDEREQTLNQLLVEMDGFGENSGIIILAATNRVDILDPAILRPGRFDRKIVIGRPDVTGREEILNVHAGNKPLAEDVDLKKVACTTAGFTGADLENLLNESAITAAKESRAYITQADINHAFIKIGMGTEKKSHVVSEKEKKITAYHEAGHAILLHVLPDMDPVYTVSIIPTGDGAAGYTMPLPENDNMFYTKGWMLQRIMVTLGGRIAESIIFDDITTGASSDIRTATHVARDMVTKYGMSEGLGMINYASDDDEVFLGRDLAHTRAYSESVAARIDEEVQRIVDDCYQKAEETLREKMDILHKCADLLIARERITREEFETLFAE